jgi:hypothetical protein
MVCRFRFDCARRLHLNNFDIFQYKRRPRITQSTLVELAKHPKLLRIHGIMQDEDYSIDETFVFIKRLNSESEFHMSMSDVMDVIRNRYVKKLDYSSDLSSSVSSADDDDEDNSEDSFEY